MGVRARCADTGKRRLSGQIVMISFAKSLLPGALLTWIISIFIGSSGSRGGLLRVHYVYYDGYSAYWSWPLFIIGTGLAWVIYLSME